MLTDTLESFKGMANDVRKANPVLAVGTGEGVGDLVKGLTGRHAKGKGPVKVELPKQQQEELERRQKAKERAEQLAKAEPKRMVAAPVTPALPPIPPVVTMAILNPPPKPKFTLVSERDVVRVSQEQDRATVLSAPGKPSSIAAVNGLEDGPREVLTYRLAPEKTVAVRLLGGRVVSVTRN